MKRKQSKPIATGRDYLAAILIAFTLIFVAFNVDRFNNGSYKAQLAHYCDVDCGY